MSQKPKTVAIGAFVIGAIMIAIGTLTLLLGSVFKHEEKVVMVFDGSVKGLNVGAPLTLRGVKVGAVTDIQLILEPDKSNVTMMVEANFDPKNIRRIGVADSDLIEELISRGMRAQLNIQSLLTGLLYVELDFYPDSPLNLADIDSPYVQLPTIPTNLQRIAKKLEDIDIARVTDELEAISTGIKSLVSGEDFQALPTNVTRTLDSLSDLSSRLQEQLASTGPKLDTVLDKTATTVSTANTEIPKLATQVESNLKTLNEAIAAFKHGMSGVDGLVAPDSPTLYELNNALKEMTRAGRSLQSLADALEAQPESVIRGKRGDEKK
jgi:paraquat-inducible protein B